MKVIKNVEPSSIYTTLIGLSSLIGGSRWTRNSNWDRGRGTVNDFDANFAPFDEKFNNAIGWNGHGKSSRYDGDEGARTFAIVNDDSLMVEQMERADGSNVIVSTGYLKNAVEYISHSKTRCCGVAMKLLDILCYIKENGFDVLECDTTHAQREFYNRFDTGINRNHYRESSKKLPLYLSQRYSKYSWKKTYIDLYSTNPKTSMTADAWEAWAKDDEWFYRKGLAISVLPSELVVTGV